MWKCFHPKVSAAWAPNPVPTIMEYRNGLIRLRGVHLEISMSAEEPLI
jgi:hypothetical protein